MSHPYLARRFVAMAHRGGWTVPDGTHRENTRSALVASVELGYEYFETDLRCTADGQVVVFHDATLNRVTDAIGRLADRSWADLAQVRVGGTEPIPRLVDLLTEFRQVRFNLDLKEDAVVAPLAELIDRLGVADRVCVASFSAARLRAFRRLAPRVLTAVTPPAVAWYGFAPGLRRWTPDAGAVLQVPVRVFRERVQLVRPDVIRAAHAAGRSVHVWTVDEPTEMERLISAGVDGIITNNLLGLRAVLVERGMWPG